MKSDAASEGKRWFEQALRDIDDARFTSEGKITFVDITLLTQDSGQGI